jgi:hypothetical protein
LRVPEIVVVPSLDQKEKDDWETVELEGEEKEEVPRSAASCRTFGVGEAV